MIQIIDKQNCCGCSACIQICPNQCISFDEDEQGFRYPLVNKELCIDCGLCEKVCPCLNQSKTRKPLKVYAAINPNEEIRMKSSSGGIFTMLAEAIIDEGGVVFGARFDENWEVMHDYTEFKEGLEAFRGSKYVQSRLGETYKQARGFLKDNRKVLFTGTSCQIAGLKTFLRKEYVNLLTVDVVCHGVPSPAVWRSYLRYINPIQKTITHINMRDKSRGWSQYSYKISSKKEFLYDDYAAHSLFLQGFSGNLYLRPSCYSCPAKGASSNSDITLADCWGYEQMCKEMYDNKGLSAVVIHSFKGGDFYKLLKNQSKVVDYNSFANANPSYLKSSKLPKYYFLFWKLFPIRGINAVSDVRARIKPSMSRVILSRIKHIIFK